MYAAFWWSKKKWSHGNYLKGCSPWKEVKKKRQKTVLHHGQTQYSVLQVLFRYSSTIVSLTFVPMMRRLVEFTVKKLNPLHSAIRLWKSRTEWVAFSRIYWLVKTVRLHFRLVYPRSSSRSSGIFGQTSWSWQSARFRIFSRMWLDLRGSRLTVSTAISVLLPVLLCIFT